MGKGKVIHMKKRLFLILSVTVMLAAGCGNKDNAAPDIEAGAAETVTDTGEQDMAEDKEAADADQAENGDAGKEQAEKGAAEETEPEDGDKEAGGTQEPKPADQPGQKEETEPVFNIEYAGVYNLNGTDFYEFRCYR